MRRLTREERVRVLAALVEGNSIRSTVRMTGISKPTVLKLLADTGRACAEHQDRAMRDLPCKKLQCDEVWTFCYAKQKNVPADHKGEFGFGDVWTWTCLDADTKLIPAWLVADRSAGAAAEFMQSVAARLRNRVQLTTDGYRMYFMAVANAFGDAIDYAQLVKLYGPDRSGEARYSPGVVTGARKMWVSGNPDRAEISTSYAERQNLTMRMNMRRFTRLTNAFSKKIENHAAAVALHFMHYNFCRVHQTLRVTPAMAAGVSDHVWELGEVVALLEAQEPSAAEVYQHSQS